MTKAELIKNLAAVGVTNLEAESVLNALAKFIEIRLIRKEELTVPGIGKFSVVEKAARTGRNPKTGETIQIAAKTVPKFTPAKALKDAAAK